MKFLKVLALSLLSFLLFLSLSIFGLVLTLNHTILSADFVVSQLDRLDISALAEEFLSQQSGEGISQEEDYLLWAFLRASDDIIADLEPWIKEQVRTAIYPSYDYLLGESQSLSLVISLEPARESVRDALWQVVLESPPPELAVLPPAELEQKFNESWDEFWDELWGNITEESPFLEFTGSSLSLETPELLEQPRQYISYFQTSYGVLIGFILLLILGIVLINRQVRGATRELGIIFATYGALEYLGIFIIKNLAGTQLSQLNIPPPLQAWLPQLLGGFLTPLEIFSICLLVAGAALIIVSFVYKPRQLSY